MSTSHLSRYIPDDPEQGLILMYLQSLAYGALDKELLHVLTSCILRAAEMRLSWSAAAREKVVGWYSTGPRLREADLDITDLMSNYCDMPLLVICEVQVSVWQQCKLQHMHISRICLSQAAPSGEYGHSERIIADSIRCALQPKAMGLPTTAYYATDEIREVHAHPYAPV